MKKFLKKIGCAALTVAFSPIAIIGGWIIGTKMNDE